MSAPTRSALPWRQLLPPSVLAFVFFVFAPVALSGCSDGAAGPSGLAADGAIDAAPSDVAAPDLEPDAESEDTWVAASDDAGPAEWDAVEDPAPDAVEDPAPDAVEDPAPDAIDDPAPDADDGEAPDAEDLVVPATCTSNSDCPGTMFCCQPQADTCDPAWKDTCVELSCPPEGQLTDIPRRGDGWLELELQALPYTCLALPWPEGWNVYVTDSGVDGEPGGWELYDSFEIHKPVDLSDPWSHGQLHVIDGLDNDVVYAVKACPVYAGTEYGGCAWKALHAMPTAAEPHEGALAIDELAVGVRPAVMGYPWEHVFAVQSAAGIHVVEGFPGTALVELAIPGGTYPQGVSAGLMQIAYAEPTPTGYGIYTQGYSGEPNGAPGTWVTLDETDWWEVHHLSVAELSADIAFQYGGETFVGKPGSLTSLGFDPKHPWLSEEGDTLLYRTKDGVFAASPPTAEPELLFDGPAGEGMPELTPDGGHVIYTSDQSGHWELWARNLDTGARRQLTGGEVRLVSAAAVAGSWILAVGQVGDTPEKRLVALVPEWP